MEFKIAFSKTKAETPWCQKTEDWTSRNQRRAQERHPKRSRDHTVQNLLNVTIQMIRTLNLCRRPKRDCCSSISNRSACQTKIWKLLTPINTWWTTTCKEIRLLTKNNTYKAWQIISNSCSYLRGHLQADKQWWISQLAWAVDSFPLSTRHFEGRAALRTRQLSW